MKLVSVEEMRAIEREADEEGWGYAQMMEQAGLGLAEAVHSFYGYLDNLTVLGLVGPGHNGGDTLVALSGLAEAGWQVRAYLVKPRKDEDPLVKRIRADGGIVADSAEDSDFELLDVWLKEFECAAGRGAGNGVQTAAQERYRWNSRARQGFGFLPAGGGGGLPIRGGL